MDGEGLKKVKAALVGMCPEHEAWVVNTGDLSDGQEVAAFDIRTISPERVVNVLIKAGVFSGFIPADQADGPELELLQTVTAVHGGSFITVSDHVMTFVDRNYTPPSTPAAS
jgi:hypothetical protein